MFLSESITDYKTYIQNTPQAISETHKESSGLAEARDKLRASNRIFFTGSGSSIPAALIGALLLTRHTTKSGIFAPSSMLLDKISLTATDTVVLVSQGWNRADAVLITRKVLKTKANLVVITGHPERIENHTSDKSMVTIVPILPVIEKIFCRPATAVTSYIKVVQLVGELTGMVYTEKEWLAAYEAGVSASPSDISADRQYIVLASSLLLCAGNNVALSLREGAGRYGALHEIESYGHGWYVPDQVHKESTHYILLANEGDSYYTQAANRIKPMLEETGTSHEVWNVPGNAVLANITIMGRTATTVLRSIERDDWDMNNPPGMEENRSFHESEGKE